MPAPDPADVATLLALELALAGRDESAIPDGYAAALEAGFVEFGQSGRVWTRADTLEALAGPARPATLRIEGFEAVELAGDVVLVTYDLVGSRAGASPSRSRRSSIWLRRDGRWRMRFHQGTRVEG